MRKIFIDRLHADQIISDDQKADISRYIQTKPFSLHWELRVLLYAGVLMLTTGLGIIIYQNIDTIGHTAIILAIAAACAGCFTYCFRNRTPYTNERVPAVSPWFDYVLLLGCLLFLALEGYLQYQYTLFGTRYGLATLVPALLFLGCAYFFDHAGVLSMGITSLAAFVGITVSPGIVWSGYNSDAPLLFSGMALSMVLIAAGYYFKVKNIKRHFTFTWYNFGFNLFFMCMLGAMFTLEMPFLYFGVHLTGCLLLGRYAVHEKSFYLLLMAVIYGYIAFTWAIFQLELYGVFGLYYFVFSCIGVIWFFMNYKKILKTR